MQVTTIGLDVAKSVFQVHGIDEQGRVALRNRLARGKVLRFFANLPRCRIGLKAGGGAHHWAREMTRLGHDTRLMPPQHVKAYIKTNKHDGRRRRGLFVLLLIIAEATQQALLGDDFSVTNGLLLCSR